MRGLGRGQTLHLVITDEVAALIEAVQASGNMLRDALAWLVTKSMASDKLQHLALCQQELHGVWRERSFKSLLSSRAPNRELSASLNRSSQSAPTAAGPPAPPGADDIRAVIQAAVQQGADPRAIEGAIAQALMQMGGGGAGNPVDAIRAALASLGFGGAGQPSAAASSSEDTFSLSPGNEDAPLLSSRFTRIPKPEDHESILREHTVLSKKDLAALQQVMEKQKVFSKRVLPQTQAKEDEQAKERIREIMAAVQQVGRSLPVDPREVRAQTRSWKETAGVIADLAKGMGVNVGGKEPAFDYTKPFSCTVCTLRNVMGGRRCEACQVLSCLLMINPSGYLFSVLVLQAERDVGAELAALEAEKKLREQQAAEAAAIPYTLRAHVEYPDRPLDLTPRTPRPNRVVQLEVSEGMTIVDFRKNVRYDTGAGRKHGKL